MAWSQLKSILKIRNTQKGCSLDANALNAFFNRFDEPCDLRDLPPLTDCDDFCSFDEVYSTISGVKLNKSPGPDHISARLLRDAEPVLTHPLAQIFNMSICQGVMPDVWKATEIKPMSKMC